jgi:hypothetical protein
MSNSTPDQEMPSKIPHFKQITKGDSDKQRVKLVLWHYILCFAASLDCCLTDIYSTFQYFLFINVRYFQIIIEAIQIKYNAISYQFNIVQRVKLVL